MGERAALVTRRGRPWRDDDLPPLPRTRGHPSDGGKVTLMAYSAGWCMVRRPGAMPFCITAAEWRAWGEPREGRGDGG